MSQPPALHRRLLTWALLGAVAVPLVVLAALLMYSVLDRHVLEEAPGPPPLEVTVTANVWWWEVRYTDPVTGHTVVGTNELRIPVGRPVRLQLRTTDGIHSLRVPLLINERVDIVPGHVRVLALQAWRPAVYEGQCDEPTASGVSRMGLQVVALAPALFTSWLAHEGRLAAAAPLTEPASARLPTLR